METDAIFGGAVIAAALILIVVLTWWSRRTIDWIARTGHRSAREILRDRRSGR
jgi:hypothetical protein